MSPHTTQLPSRTLRRTPSLSTLPLLARVPTADRTQAGGAWEGGKDSGPPIGAVPFTHTVTLDPQLRISMMRQRRHNLAQLASDSKRLAETERLLGPEELFTSLAPQAVIARATLSSPSGAVYLYSLTGEQIWALHVSGDRHIQKREILTKSHPSPVLLSAQSGLTHRIPKRHTLTSSAVSSLTETGVAAPAVSLSAAGGAGSASATGTASVTASILPPSLTSHPGNPSSGGRKNLGESLGYLYTLFPMQVEPPVDPLSSLESRIRSGSQGSNSSTRVQQLSAGSSSLLQNQDSQQRDSPASNAKHLSLLRPTEQYKTLNPGVKQWLSNQPRVWLLGHPSGSIYLGAAAEGRQQFLELLSKAVSGSRLRQGIVGGGLHGLVLEFPVSRVPEDLSLLPVSRHRCELCIGGQPILSSAQFLPLSSSSSVTVPRTPSSASSSSSSPLMENGGNENLEHASRTRFPGSVMTQHSLSPIAQVAPVWVQKKGVKSCCVCRQRFSLVKKKRHCKNCGAVFCSQCCGFEATLAYTRSVGARFSVCTICNRYAMSLQELKDIVASLTRVRLAGLLPFASSTSSTASSSSAALGAAAVDKDPSQEEDTSIAAAAGEVLDYGLPEEEHHHHHDDDDDGYDDGHSQLDLEPLILQAELVTDEEEDEDGEDGEEDEMRSLQQQAVPLAEIADDFPAAE